MILKDVATDTLERMRGTIFFKSKQHPIHDFKGPQKNNYIHVSFECLPLPSRQNIRATRTLCCFHY